jgi:phosphoribosyl-ATP pyrophosphohydrolase
LDLETLKFDERGLISAIVQDFYTKKVLTLAYMNRESYEITLREGYTCFWSRSRNELWRKGETSGNRQRVVKISGDCDGDALCVEVIKDGPACHLGTDSCFENLLYDSGEPKKFELSGLYDLLLDRDEKRPEGSYTTYLFEKGQEKILKKLGEECSEVIIAAMKGDRAETVYEIADLCYHALVLMVNAGISTDDICAELESRHVIDKKSKQEYLGGESEE